MNQWDDVRNAANQNSISYPNWTDQHSSFLTNNSSVFSSDSGLGSYENCFSEVSQRPENSYGNPGFYEQQAALSACTHSSEPSVQPEIHQYPPSSQHPSKCFGYGTLHFLKPGPSHPYSLPDFLSFDRIQAGLQEGSSNTLWIGQTRSAHSLPAFHGPADAYRGSQTALGLPTVSLKTEREEVRRNLHAIFKPFQVDKVMAMFPKLNDAEQLAEEIISLKSKGEL